MPEPILWANKTRRTAVVVVDGEQRTERIPQRGHDGNSDYDKPTVARGPRWIRYIQADGTDARVPITNAAAHLDADTTYAKMIRQKARVLGWIPVGACPCALVMTGELNPKHIIDPSVRASEPCKPNTYGWEHGTWCPHVVAEQKARTKRHTEQMAKQANKLKADVEKLLEAQKDQTKEIVSGLREAVTEIAHAMTSGPPQDKGKRDR